ncbi:hypothetical protein [Desulfurococcus amylolyticus]|uniref:Uncharacterized protein n=1 Tax=Desulfurococcus amylolyticus (strain DSM 18924 / JCM 16383 / VKM B-2413 / 1221n) TaxID=490899 RepID=B8D3V3_DESA1|nr:hypothetical protein [Desulfurococcus amylolyticus]ACL10784.1 hypothetical protein DKAM_0458 [Desulfurococcus amylolyticus 1221n]
MSNILKMKQGIVRLIDESSEQAYKIAFYSNPDVSRILERLIAEWERNNRKGIPLDYATEEEVEVMYNIAVKISKTPPQALMSTYLSEIMPSSSGEKKKR